MIGKKNIKKKQFHSVHRYFKWLNITMVVIFTCFLIVKYSYKDELPYFYSYPLYLIFGFWLGARFTRIIVNKELNKANPPDQHISLN